MGKPSYYSSHSFCSLMFESKLRHAISCVRELTNGTTSETQMRGEVPVRRTMPRTLNFLDDYIFRPIELEHYSWYFLVAACDAAGFRDHDILQWYSVSSKARIWSSTEIVGWFEGNHKLIICCSRGWAASASTMQALLR